jgi:hypothetical protein
MEAVQGNIRGRPTALVGGVRPEVEDLAGNEGESKHLHTRTPSMLVA